MLRLLVAAFVVALSISTHALAGPQVALEITSVEWKPSGSKVPGGGGGTLHLHFKVTNMTDDAIPFHRRQLTFVPLRKQKGDKYATVAESTWKVVTSDVADQGPPLAPNKSATDRLEIRSHYGAFQGGSEYLFVIQRPRDTEAKSEDPPRVDAAATLYRSQ